MDLNSGKIIQLTEEEVKKLSNDGAPVIPLKNRPKNNCKKCLGKGYKTVLVPIKIPCPCTGVDTTSKEYYAAQAQVVFEQLEKMETELTNKEIQIAKLKAKFKEAKMKIEGRKIGNE